MCVCVCVCVCVCITESLCCTAEINTTCKSTILQLKIIFKKRQNILQFFSNLSMPYPLPFRLKAKVLEHVPGISQYNLCSEHSFLTTLPLASTLASHTSARFPWLFILPGTLSLETAPLLPPPGRRAAKSRFPAKSSRSRWHQACTSLQPSTPVTVSETWHC